MKAKAVVEAVEPAGIKEALRRPVIRRKVTERWDDDRGEWVPETKESEIGIGPVGAVVAALAGLGLATAIVSGVSEAAARKAAQQEAGNAPSPVVEGR